KNVTPNDNAGEQRRDRNENWKSKALHDDKFKIKSLYVQESIFYSLGCSRIQKSPKLRNQLPLVSISEVADSFL
ncbi:MAG TPA: hypothetical protein VF626_06195, partial [Chthoniobacterales bacterium]